MYKRQVEGGEAISKLSCYYSRDTGLAVAIGLEDCTAQEVAAMQVKLDQLMDQANTLSLIHISYDRGSD